MIASQPKPGKVERTDEAVLRNFFGRQGRAGFVGNFAHESFSGLLFVVSGAEDLSRDIAPTVQTLAIVRDVACRLIGETEVRQEQLPRLKFRDGIERSVPQFDVNIRWRSGGKNERLSFNADAGGVADERDAFARVKIGDVMECVAGCIEHAQFPRTERKRLAAREHVQIFLGDRQKVAEQTTQIVAIQPLSAGEQIRRVGHMIGAARVNINLQMRIFLYKGTAGAGVVQMNVRQENGLQVSDGAVVSGELLAKILQRGGGTGIHERAKIAGQQ